MICDTILGYIEIRSILHQWEILEMRKNNFMNKNKKLKDEKMSKKLGVPYFYFAKKPFKFGFNRAK